MAISLTTLTDGTAISAADVNTNFTNIRSYVQGSLTNSDLSGSAGITAANLAVSEFQYQIVLNVPQALFNAGAANFVAAACPINNTADNYTYTITHVSAVCTDIGSSACDFSLVYGTASQLNSVSGYTVIQDFAVSGSDGTFLLFDTNSPTVSSITAADSAPLALAVVVTDKGTGAMGAATDFITVTCTLQRDIV